MAVAPGTYDLGPENGDIALRTTCAGAMARMGHELTLVVDQWNGRLEVGEVPSDCVLRVTCDLTSLRIAETRGGAKPASDKDKRDILANAAKSLDTRAHPQLTFVSEQISGSWQAGTVAGRLAVHGRSQPQTFDIRAEGEGYVLAGTITQTRFGIKPFSTMMGALKLGDDVTVEALLTV